MDLPLLAAMPTKVAPLTCLEEVFSFLTEPLQPSIIVILLATQLVSQVVVHSFSTNAIRFLQIVLSKEIVPHMTAADI